jgi:hypothetical protein
LYYNNTNKAYTNESYKTGDELGILIDMWEGELKFSINGVDKGVAHKDPELTLNELFFTIIYYELN